MELLQEAETWVGVGLLIFLAIVVIAKVPGLIARNLDARAQAIQNELDEAQRIRAEAEAMLATLVAERKAAEQQAKDMLTAAQDEAKRLAAEGAARLEESLARRQQLAERKIAAAQAQAEAEVKAAAVELAAQAAEDILAARLATQAGDPIADASIKALAGAKLQ